MSHAILLHLANQCTIPPLVSSIPRRALLCLELGCCLRGADVVLTVCASMTGVVVASFCRSVSVHAGVQPSPSVPGSIRASNSARARTIFAATVVREEVFKLARRSACGGGEDIKAEVHITVAHDVTVAGSTT